MKKKCGYVSIIGRPNVGKSTLLNHLIQQKVCITSRKPQTTRHQQLGIKTTESAQMIFVDTPGIHQAGKNVLNRYMNQEAKRAIQGVDLLVMVVEAMKWREEDALVLKELAQTEIKVILVVNKIDRVKQKVELLPYLQKVSKEFGFHEIIPVSAKGTDNLDALENVLIQNLPDADFVFGEDEVTDKSSRFLVAEIIREKIIRQLGDELPYEMTVEIEKFDHRGHIVHIEGLILVDRKSQKSIVIGVDGSRMKTIGSDARVDIETLLQCKVMLNLWVKVKAGWADSERALKSLNQFKDFQD